MSATNRGAARSAHDTYLTPPFCVHRLLERCDLPGGDWLEPAAGAGDIIRAAARPDVRWTAIDIRPECRAPLETLGASVRTGDFLTMDELPRFAVAITNPPFSFAREYLERLLPMCDAVVMLLRLNWLGGDKRADLLSENMPDVYVLPNRPSFTGEGTDATEYAWFVWREAERRSRGTVQILARTPRKERGAAATAGAQPKDAASSRGSESYGAAGTERGLSKALHR